MVSLIDASSAIYAWENYPIKQFPKLWDWLDEQIEEEHIQSIKAIMAEIGHKEEECYDWLINKEIKTITINDEIAQQSLLIKEELGIVTFSRSPKGVDLNDVYLIATAKIMGGSCISNEAIQLAMPKNKENCKIPLVCSMQSPVIKCLNFIDFIKASDIIF